MQPGEQPKKKRSPWFYIGLGCGIPALLAAIGITVLILFTVKKVQEVQEDMANPITRTEKVKKALGAQALPDGYSAVMTLSVPAIVDTVVLSTRSPEGPHAAQEKEDERTFLYFRLKASSLNDLEELREYLEGRSDDPSVLARNNIHIRTEQILGRGAIPLQDYRLLYLAQRGSLETSQGQNQGPGLNSIMLIECPGQSHIRLGLWLAPDPSPEAPTEQLDLKGTPVDEKAMRAFMSHFNPCQES